MNTKNDLPDRIIFFDGECFLCSGLVTYILKRDKKKDFYFATIQSGILDEYTKSDHKRSMDTLIFYQKGIFYEKSEAVLKIMKYLPYWKYFVFLKYFPLSWRDRLYDIVAKNRYRIFGKKDSCMLPEDKWKMRFIE